MNSNVIVIYLVVFLLTYSFVTNILVWGVYKGQGGSYKMWT